MVNKRSRTQTSISAELLFLGMDRFQHLGDQLRVTGELVAVELYRTPLVFGIRINLSPAFRDIYLPQRAGRFPIPGLSAIGRSHSSLIPTSR